MTFDLALWRHTRKYSPVQAASLFGLSVRQYNRVEHGSSPIPAYIHIIVALLARLSDQERRIAAIQAAPAEVNGQAHDTPTLQWPTY